MTNTKEIILKLKEVRKEKDLSYGDILELMEQNGDYLSRSTISRVFQDGSKDKRIDVLLESVQAKDSRFEEVLRLILACPCRNAHKED